MATIGTFNEEGVNVDLYIPRKCHATNNLITSYDHSAVQIAIANVDANGVINGTTTTFCIAGYLRCQAASDHAINHLAIAKGMIRIKTGKKPRAKKVKGLKGIGARGAAKGAPQQRGARAAPGQRGAAQRGGAQKGNARRPQQKQPQQRGARPARNEEGGRPQRGSKNAPQSRQQQGRNAPRPQKA
ncbi:40S ribosomal protein S21 [Trypanosoma conorhini]|uniref:40S ribosomal protein S21 n=1 Tax=Trypanosoma conorhini TaxID=83891 RepID=A0A422PYT9_9TRYP|nr:40S ribosomal protein S21 [Trypanosoma conorhini]RNF22892.1 40S ribosomal protein S21 [Trypanosoma conorhini]